MIRTANTRPGAHRRSTSQRPGYPRPDGWGAETRSHQNWSTRRPALLLVAVAALAGCRIVVPWPEPCDGCATLQRQVIHVTVTIEVPDPPPATDPGAPSPAR